MSELTLQRIRSYVLRQGRMTRNQQRAYAELAEQHVLPYTGELIDFNVCFARRAPLVCEIGFGMGRSLVKLAQHHPDMNFIGIEVHAPGVGSCLHAMRESAVTNLKIIQHDAMEVLAHCFAAASVSKLNLFFPDPWPKKRHHKRRIVQQAFLDAVAGVLRVGGRLQMATDWQPYAEWMLEQTDVHPQFSNVAGRGCFVAARQGRFATKFELRGQRLGHKIFDLLYERQ